jgi:hypothetical protein
MLCNDDQGPRGFAAGSTSLMFCPHFFLPNSLCSISRLLLCFFCFCSQKGEFIGETKTLLQKREKEKERENQTERERA